MKTDVPWGSPAGLLRLVALALLLLDFVPPVHCQDDDPPHEPAPAEVETIKSQALALLQNVLPGKASKPPRAITTLETPEGSVRWGNLFEASEISALVNVYTGKSTSYWDHPPKYLCYFTWANGQWTFRQFLGNVYSLSIHYWKGTPSIFLQGSRREGRYEGEFLSWYYDPKNRTLERTHFEDWGPFHLAGNYLICDRGFERLAHDETKWIYSYKDGLKGRLLAIFHWNDMNYFEVTLPRSKSDKMEIWCFQMNDDSTAPVKVTCRLENSKGNESELIASAELFLKNSEDLSQEYCFQLLTGLNPALLDSEMAWREKLPEQPPLQRIPLKASGDSKIVKLFQWPPAHEHK